MVNGKHKTHGKKGLEFGSFREFMEETYKNFPKFTRSESR
jgi:hypothetical protein